MTIKLLSGLGAFIAVFGIPIPICMWIAYSINGFMNGGFIGIGFIFWILFMTCIGIIINIVSAIKDKWDKIKVPEIITSEKAQKQAGKVSIV